MGELLNREADDDDDNDDNNTPLLTWHPIAVEREVLYVLDSKPAPYEQLLFAFRRKESELRVLFAGLSLADARELHRRLSLMLPNDPIATRFMGLVVERRARLIAFLADARRRHSFGSRQP
jgi:hypothetical protein